MFNFKVSIKRHYKNRIEFVQISMIALIFGLVAFAHLLILGIILLIILLCGSIILYLKEKKQKFVPLSFEENNLIIEQEFPIKIAYASIQNIVLIFYSIKGEGVFPTRAIIGIPKTGHENTITIITKEGQKIIKNIWCESDLGYRRLKLLGEFLKEKGIDVKMKGFNR